MPSKPEKDAPARELDPTRPFTRAEAIAAGISPKALRGSRYRRIFRGVHVSAQAKETPLQRAEAALLLFAGRPAHASHATAARIHGVPLPALPDEHVTVRDERSRHAVEGIRVHRATKAHVTRRGGIEISTPRQMFVELASLLSFVDLVVVGDNMVRSGMVRLTELRTFCEETNARCGAAARRAAAYVREDVDSPMETRLRLLIVLAGLPEPQVNLTLRTEQGDPYRKYDLSYPEIKVIVEYDGRPHIERVEQWEDDLARRESIDDDGWRILVVTAKGIYTEPHVTVLRVWRLLRARGLAGVPREPAADWRPHFPGRR